MILVVEKATGCIGFGAVFLLAITASALDNYLLWCSFFSFGNFTNCVSILAMAYSVPLVPNYVYVVIRLKMAENINSLVGSALFCHCGETHNVFPIGGLVQPGETLTAATICHCRHLVYFRIEQNDRLYIYKIRIYI